MYWIKDNNYIIGAVQLEGAVSVPKRPSTAHSWNGSEWIFNGFTADQALNKLREKRNQLLASTDWMANSDVTMTEEWRVYRQALRDITTQTPSLDSDGNLTGITWPIPPND